MGIMRFWFLGSTIERLPEGMMYVSDLSSSSHARNTGGKLKSAKKKRWIFCIWAFYSGMVRIKRILLVAVVKWNITGGRCGFWSHFSQLCGHSKRHKMWENPKMRWFFYIGTSNSGMVGDKRILIFAVVHWNKKEGRHAFWSHYA